MARPVGKREPMSPLAAFLDEELRARSWSNERAAMEAAKRGHYVTGETVRKARRDMYREPLPLPTIEALATAFGVKPERIQQLDRQRWDLGPTSSDDVEAAILADPTVTERDKRIMLELRRSMQAAAEAGHSQTTPGRSRRKA